MEEQTIISCNDNGLVLGYIPRALGHTGIGKRHLAITVLLYNSNGEILLQKRKHKVFDNIWCFTADTHPLHLSQKDESFEDATKRALREEYRIRNVPPLQNLGTFNYYAKYGERCENEHCAMLIAEYDGEINMDPEVGYENKWVAKMEFLKDFESNPGNYAPWVPGGVEVLKKSGFFS